MTQTPPHRTLMQLHRLVDRALGPLLEPMALEHATEGYVVIDRSDIDALVEAHGDPQAVLAGFGSQASDNGLMVAEPALASAILSRIWRSDRNAGAPLTQVEGEILRQFLARIVGAWSAAWGDQGVRLLPDFSMAGSLSMLRPQVAEGTWHVARTVVRDRAAGTTVGVLLFCYPDALVARLAEQARATTWRARLARGIGERDRDVLHHRLGTALRDVVITAPVRIEQHVTLGMLNELERGDVIAFDADVRGDVTFAVLGRQVTGRLARHGDKVALSLSGPVAAPAAAADPAVAAPGQPPANPAMDHTGDGPPEPIENWNETVAS